MYLNILIYGREAKTVPLMGTNLHQNDVIMTLVVLVELNSVNEQKIHLIIDVILVQFRSRAKESFFASRPCIITFK